MVNLKMREDIFILFVFIILIESSISPVLSEEIAVATDTFESGDWNGGTGFLSSWYHEGDSSIVTTDYYEGSRSLRLRRRNGYVDRGINLGPYDNAKIGLYYKVNSFEASDYAVLRVSPDGINWYTLKTFTPIDSDGLYHYLEYNITEYGLTDNFYIALDSEMSGIDDILNIDSIIISTFRDESIPDPNYTMPTWHIQFNPAPLNPSDDVMYWDLDPFDTANETIETLRNKGVTVICYFSAGSYEDWRPDGMYFPIQCLGNSNGWPGEKWVDIRCPEVLEIMKSRVDLGISKGCDGFDPDNMDAYSNNPGFDISEQDSIDYYNHLADYIHSKSKMIGLKNALTMIDDVLDKMDYAINEQCFFYNECNYLDPVINSGKPVFQIEYGGENRANEVCAIANMKGYSTLIKNMQLDEYEISCQEFNLSNFDSVASDSFESGDWDGGAGFLSSWYHEGDSKVVNINDPFEGSYHLRLRKNNGYVERSLDLSNHLSLKLGLYYKVNSFEASDYAVLRVSPDGINWYTLKTFTPIDSDGLYHYLEYNITEYGLTDNFYIALDSEMSGTNDQLYIDKMKVF